MALLLVLMMMTIMKDPTLGKTMYYEVRQWLGQSEWVNEWIVYTWSFDDIVYDVDGVNYYEGSCIMKASTLWNIFLLRLWSLDKSRRHEMQMSINNNNK